MDWNDYRLSTRLQLSPEVTEAVYSGIVEIDAIKHTTMARKQLAAIFHTTMAFNHTFKKITQHRK